MGLSWSNHENNYNENTDKGVRTLLSFNTRRRNSFFWHGKFLLKVLLAICAYPKFPAATFFKRALQKSNPSRSAPVPVLPRPILCPIPAVCKPVRFSLGCKLPSRKSCIFCRSQHASSSFSISKTVEYCERTGK